MRKVKGIILFFLLLSSKYLLAQNWEIGFDAGRAYYHYQYKDYGDGYSNAPKANHGLPDKYL